jgi:uncharacterized membrane protein YhaH (DUF805 family)
MSGLSLIVFLVLVAYSLWCYTRILNRTGRSPWWAVLMLVPILNLALVWLFAFVRWPRIDRLAPPPRPSAEERGPPPPTERLY